MTPEEELIQRYFDAFNRHDLEGVMACFHDEPVIIDVEGRRFEGREAIGRRYEENFTSMPDCHCDLSVLTGHSGYGVAESLFQRARPRYGTIVLEIGVEVMQIADGRIREIRGYRRSLPVQEAQGCSE